MRVVILSLICLVSFARHSYADLVLTLEQEVAGPILVGTTAVFNLFIRSDPTAISNLAGIDFSVDAADPAATTTATAGGRFISGTSDFFPTGTSPAPYQIPFPTSFALFSANNGTGLNLGTTNTLLASLTLDASGATPGTYSMGLGNLTAVDPGFNSIAISNLSTASVSYTISAVPEPSAMYLIGVVFAACISGKWCVAQRAARYMRFIAEFKRHCIG
jgi:hypothetical protein